MVSLQKKVAPTGEIRYVGPDHWIDNLRYILMATAPVERVEATPQQLASGEGLYARNCAVCHGPQGEGIPGGNAPQLQATAALADVRNILTRGAPEMPPLGGVLTAEEIDSLARFVKVRLAGPVEQN
jgi:mono/diheme cytochrome c family protein